MKTFIGTCVGNPFRSVDDLCQVIDDAREISKKTFLKRCDVPSEQRQDFTDFPNDVSFFVYNGKIGRGIYFYTWSMIEHFYN